MFTSMFEVGANFMWLVVVIAFVIYLTNKNKKMENGTTSGQPARPQAAGANALNAPRAVAAPVKSKYSALSIFMAVVLFGILVMFGERLIFDLNRYINPVIDDGYTQWQNQKPTNGRRGIDVDGMKSPVYRSYEMTQDSVNAVSSTQIYFPAQEKGRYLMYKLIIHAAVIVPIFILAFVLFYYKRKNLQLKPLLVSFLTFAFWMMFHLLGETINFVMNTYRNIAIYVILIVLGIVFAVVAYYSQAKHQKGDK